MTTDYNVEGPSAQRYSTLERFRDPFLRRARQCSELTIPALIPPEGWTGTSDLYTPFQSVGARGVNNLASKLLLVLFPPNAPCFRYRVDEYALDKMEQNENLKTKVEIGLGKMERAIVTEIETTGVRVPMFEALKHMIVGGNILIYMPPEGGVKVFHLSRYVVKRDPMGHVLEIITKEDVALSALPKDVRAMVEAIADYEEKKNGGAQQATADPSYGDEKTCSIYTHVKRGEGSWRVHQEIKGKVIPDSRGTYPLDKSPWMALRFTAIECEDYGRGYVEEYLGDLGSLEGLAQAIVEGSAGLAKLLFLVNPNGTTSINDIAKAPNCAVRAGNALDVTVLQAQKSADLSVAANTSKEIEQRLSMAFLLNSAIQREGERVTAEEIRVMARDLEDALGGIYSVLSQDLQLPFITRLQFQMQKQGRLPRLPKGVVRPSIVTGLEALGRGHDMAKLDQFIAGLPPEVAAQYIVWPEYLDRRATALGIETKGLIKTPDMIQAEAQAAQQQAMMTQFGPELMKQVGGMMTEKMKQGGSVEDMAKDMQSQMGQMQQAQ
jgi:hypothetical protein